MNRIETLFCVLAEECAEVAQRASKAQRFGADQRQAGQAFTNAERVNYELQDIYAMVEMIRADIGSPWFGARNDEAIASKKRKVESYMAQNRDLDALDTAGST
jgi:NTP pyrophosphatase (non-canonical NTP hydrolase)